MICKENRFEKISFLMFCAILSGQVPMTFSPLTTVRLMEQNRKFRKRWVTEVI